MNCVYALYLAGVIGVAVGIGISWLMGAARGNWNDSETACELIEGCLRQHPGSSPELITKRTGLAIETVRLELARMHEDGAVWASRNHDPHERSEAVFHLVGRRS